MRIVTPTEIEQVAWEGTLERQGEAYRSGAQLPKINLGEPDLPLSSCYASVACHGEKTLLSDPVGVAGGPNLLDLRRCILPGAVWTG